MLTLIIGIVVGLGTGALANVWLSPVWSVLIGVVCFLAVTILINLRVKKHMEALFTGVQRVIEANQDQLRRKINIMQNKMMTGGKGLQRQLEKEQEAGIREALLALDRLAPLKKWNFLVERQANTVRAQLCFQIKDFEAADRHFEKAFIMDPLTLAMKMVRLYKRGDMAAVEKAFRKGVKRFKDEQGTMIYALYSWILVEAERIDEAIQVLDDGRGKTESEVLKTNWEHLVNGRNRRFSNAALGDQWYALHLETPKPIKVRQHMGGSRRLR